MNRVKMKIAQLVEQKTIHLNRYYHFTELMRDPTVVGSLLRYQSDYDGTTQSIFILEPTGKKFKRIFFFFHGMDGDAGDGVVVRELVTKLNAQVICMGGRGPAWISDAFLADAEQVISKYSGNSEGYYMIGISMGGSQVLALPGLLPQESRIHKAIRGIIALTPGSNLLSIVTKSAHQRVRDTLRASVNGNISKLQQRSPNQLIDQYPSKLPFVIFYNGNDQLLLTNELKVFIQDLHHKGHPVSTFSAPGNHNFTYRNFDYEAVFKELGKDSTVTKKPPLLKEES